jgi:hypothetical protein
MFLWSFWMPVQAYYHPDTAGNPVWNSADPEPTDGPDLSDHDGDGLPAWQEAYLQTNPTAYDTDLDGINDGTEVTTTGTNPTLADTDGNGRSDLDDFYYPIPLTTPEEAPPPPPDTDGDGLTDEFEATYSATNPALWDTDGNNRNDHDDYYYPITYDPYAFDTDSDGLNDGVELYESHTNPQVADSDGNGRSDYQDYFTPVDPDTDNDGLTDVFENTVSMTNPAVADSDGNGRSDSEDYFNPVPAPPSL